jgi:hypothetical protein
MITKEECDYAYCYCEENIYRFAELLQTRFADELQRNQRKVFVIFLSNPRKQTLIWKQKSSSDPDEPVCWDYHVILCVRSVESEKEEENLIYDFDSLLPFPCDLSFYCKEAFRPDLSILPRFRQ